MRLKILLSCVGIISSALGAERTLPIVDMPTYADAANNEGGLVARHLREDQFWGAFHQVADNPFDENEMGRTFDDYAKHQFYPLKESDNLSYNEARTNQGYGLLLTWTIDNLLKMEEELTCHVHRGGNGIIFINTILVPLLADFYEFNPEVQMISNQPKDFRIRVLLPMGKSILMRNGYDPKTYGGYERSRGVLSLGHVMGVNKNWGPGTLLLTEDFIPTNETKCSQEGTKGVIYEGNTYSTPNILKANLVKMLSDHERQKKVVNIINGHPKKYHSPNPKKTFGDVVPLTENDFKMPRTLNILTLYSPKMTDQNFVIFPQYQVSPDFTIYPSKL